MKTWTVSDLAKFAKSRQDNELDLTIALTGAKGLGKSTLGVELAEAVMGKDFSFPKCILLTPDPQAIAKHIDATAKNPVIVLDESIGSLYTENWAASSQKALHIYLNQFQRRGKNAILVLCIPSIYDLRGVLVRSSVDIWVHVLSRGTAVVMLRSPAPVEDPFFRKELYEVYTRTAKSMRRWSAVSQYEEDFQRVVYSRMKTFVAFLEFPALEPAFYADYLAHVEGQREEVRKAIFAVAEDERVKTERRRKLLERLECEEP